MTEQQAAALAAKAAASNLLHPSIIQFCNEWYVRFEVVLTYHTNHVRESWIPIIVASEDQFYTFLLAYRVFAKFIQ